MTSSVRRTDLLFQEDVDQRLSAPGLTAVSKYQRLLSPVLKKRRRSFSCSKLPPLNSAGKGSPVPSSASTRASSTASTRSADKGSPVQSCDSTYASPTTSTRSPSKSSSCVSLNSAGSPPAHCSSINAARSHSKCRNGLSSVEIPAKGKSPPSSQQNLRQSRQSSRSTQTTWSSECELFPKLPNSLTDSLFVSRRRRSEHKPSSKGDSLNVIQDQARIQKNMKKAGSNMHNTLAPLLEQHHTISKLFHERNTGTAKCETEDFDGKDKPGNTKMEKSHTDDTDVRDPPGMHHSFDTVTKKDFDCDISTSLMSSLTDAMNTSFDCEKSRPEPASKDSEVNMPQNPQPTDLGDGSSSVRTFEALVSPLRNVGRAKLHPRTLFRGQSVGQLGATCLPEQKLQAVTSTFSEYDADGNGRLSLSEFHKLLKDQGMSIESTELKEVVAMVLPDGSSSLLSSPNSVNLAAFTELVAHGVRAEALREEQYHGYSMEQANLLREVFDAYDSNHSGVLEATELGNLLQDIGQAPRTFSEQEELHSVLKRISGGSLRPLQFRDFLEFAKVLETTSIGSGGGDQNEHQPEHRRGSACDVMQIARKAGLTMADVVLFQDIFDIDAKNGTLCSAELYDLLKSRLRLKAAEGEREMQVHATIQKYAGVAGTVYFEDFLVIVGDLVDAKLATVSSILGREDRSTNHFLGHLAVLLE